MKKSKAPNKWSVLIILSLAAFVMVIDTTSMNVSISNVVADLNTELGIVQMIMATYTLTMAVCMLPSAKAADIFGKKRVFKCGVLLYGIGTITASQSVNWVMLLFGWAVIQGFACALMMPSAMSLIQSAYKGKDRTIAMSIYAAMASVALAVGPIFGGTITTYLSWRYVFGLEALIVLAIILSFRTISKIECEEPDKRARFDFAGMVLLGLSLVSLIMGALLSKEYGWFLAKKPLELFGATVDTGVSLTALLLCCAAIFMLLFIMHLNRAKKRDKSALIDTDVFKSRTFVFVMLTNLLIQLSFISTLFVVSVYMQNAAGYDALHTGLTLLPLSVMLFITALCAVKASARIAPNRVIAFGALAVLGGALYMFYTFSSESALLGVSGLRVSPAMILLGMGLGCTLSLTNNIGLSSLSAHHANQGSGTLTTVNNLGSSLGTSIMGSLLISGIFTGIAHRLVGDSRDVSQISRALEEGVRKMQGAEGDGLAALNLTPGQLENAKNVLMGGLNDSICNIFIIVGILAAVAFVVALVFLRSGNTQGVPNETQSAVRP